MSDDALLGSIVDLQLQVRLITAASALASEGRERATVSEVTSWLREQLGVEVSPSKAGQVFSALGLRSTVHRGKSRLLLDKAHLETLARHLAAREREVSSWGDETLRLLSEVSARVHGLEQDLLNLQRLARREEQIKAYLHQQRHAYQDLIPWEKEYQRVCQMVARTRALQQECEKLAPTVQALQALEQRRKKLLEEAAVYEAQEKEIWKQEQALAPRLARLRERVQWVTLLGLQEAIAQHQAEVDRLARLLGEKRSLWEKVLHRRREQEAAQ